MAVVMQIGQITHQQEDPQLVTVHSLVVIVSLRVQRNSQLWQGQVQKLNTVP